MRISDWSSDVCSSDLAAGQRLRVAGELELAGGLQFVGRELQRVVMVLAQLGNALRVDVEADRGIAASEGGCQRQPRVAKPDHGDRSEEHTSGLQSLMRTSYAVFCLKKKKQEKK